MKFYAKQLDDGKNHDMILISTPCGNAYGLVHSDFFFEDGVEREKRMSTRLEAGEKIEFQFHEVEK